MLWYFEGNARFSKGHTPEDENLEERHENFWNQLDYRVVLYGEILNQRGFCHGREAFKRAFRERREEVGFLRGI